MVVPHRGGGVATGTTGRVEVLDVDPGPLPARVRRRLAREADLAEAGHGPDASFERGVSLW